MPAQPENAPDILALWRAMLVEMIKRFGVYTYPDGKIIRLAGYPPKAADRGRQVPKLTYTQAQRLFKVWENVGTQLMNSLMKAGRPVSHLQRDYKKFLDQKIDWTLYVTGGGCHPQASGSCQTFPNGLIGSGGLLTAPAADSAIYIVQSFVINLSAGQWTAFDRMTVKEALLDAASGSAIMSAIARAAVAVAGGIKNVKAFIDWTVDLVGDTLDITGALFKYAIWGGAAFAAYWAYTNLRK